jgi:hypothetical protein
MATREYKPTTELTEEDGARLWSGVDRSGGPDACWLWIRSTNNQGYGQFGIHHRGKKRLNFLAHRIAYFLGYGVDPGPLLVCHTCDQKRCCNPKHLWCGTHADNNRDAAAKGLTPSGERHFWRRHPEVVRWGEKNPTTKLKETEVIEIRTLHASGMSQTDIAAKFGMKRTTVGAIVRRENWRKAP